MFMYLVQIWVYSSLSPDIRNVSPGIKFNWTATYNVHSTVPIIPFILYNEEGYVLSRFLNSEYACI